MEGTRTHIQTCNTSVDLEWSCKELCRCQLCRNGKKKKAGVGSGGVSVKLHHNMDAAYSKVTAVSLELYVILRLSIFATNTYHTVD